MKYFFILNHPAHFHLFKHVIKILGINGHKCFIYIRPKDVLENLLFIEGFKYEILTSHSSPKKNIIISSILRLVHKEYELTKRVIKYQPDLLIGTDWAIVHIGRLFNIHSLIFNEDDTLATPENRFFYPLAKTLILPECCDRGLWEKKRVSYNGYHELAYLHPKHFIPAKINTLANFETNKPFIIIRLVMLTASHDIGKKGLGVSIILRLIEKYQDKFNFIVSSEDQIVPELEKYRFIFPPSFMHHFLAEARLVVSDSQTMIAEAAILGTPSIRFNDFVGKLSYLEELENKYRLTYGIKTDKSEELILKVKQLLTNHNIKEEWMNRRNTMIKDKIDVKSFMVWFIENYPQSLIIMKKNPNYQYNFK